MMKQWHSCYDSGWKGIITPESFQHPAKMSRSLLSRILAHAKEQGWLAEGDVIIDPFGGIGSTGILGAYEGYQVVCCELEQKFCKLAEQNFELHKDAWLEFSNPFPVILQGDSRRLCDVVEKADCIVSSPPYAESSIEQTHMTSNKRGDESDPGYRPSWKKKLKDGYADTKRPYGQTPGQLGSMKPGKVDMVVSSPPYAEALSARGGRQMAQMGLGNAKAGKDDRCKDAIGYSQNPKNLGNLKSGDVDCVISSPPYEGTEVATGNQASVEDRKRMRADGTWEGYNKANSDNLGSNKGDTFWQAAKTIVEQCHQILKPGGHAIWVVKSFVRNKRIVDFPSDWQRLCESVGFKTVCVHHAMLVKETTYKTLFGDTETKKIERKSFFRRLAESKGSPRIDFEVVLCTETPK